MHPTDRYHLDVNDYNEAEFEARLDEARERWALEQQTDSYNVGGRVLCSAGCPFLNLLTATVETSPSTSELIHSLPGEDKAKAFVQELQGLVQKHFGPEHALDGNRQMQAAQMSTGTVSMMDLILQEQTTNEVIDQTPFMGYDERIMDLTGVMNGYMNNGD